MHKFKVGQIVGLRVALRDETPEEYRIASPKFAVMVRAEEAYSIVREMPEDVTGMPQYRIKGETSGVERAVREVEITPYETPLSGA